jgi:hypothetical protein
VGNCPDVTAGEPGGAEGDRAYLLESGEFRLDPGQLTAAVSRAERRRMLFASRSIFSLSGPGEETFANSLLCCCGRVRQCCGRETGAVWGGKENGGTEA